MANRKSDDEWRVTLNLAESRHAEVRRDQIVKRISIFRVPVTLLNENKEAYIPQMISFGPFHYSQSEALSAMETEKSETVRYNVSKLRDDYLAKLELIGGGNASELPLGNFFAEVFRCRDFYDNLHLRTFDQNAAFACMMFRDAFYIYVFFKEFSWSEEDGIWISENSGKPVFIDIIKDIVKLENQIPLLLIETIYNDMGRDTNDNDTEISFDKFVLEKCNYFSPFVVKEEYALFNIHGNLSSKSHLLECIRAILVGRDQNLENQPCDVSCFGHLAHWMKRHIFGFELSCWLYRPQVTLSTAVELQKAGIKFKPFYNGGGILSIRFEKATSTLHLPAIHVDVVTETVMRNVIAFEVYSARMRKTVTSYVHFMNDIINTSKDVALLKESGIISHELGSDKKVAKMWSALSNSTSRPFFLHIFNATREMKEVYKQRRLRILCSEFKEIYCARPWVVLSPVGAILLLFLTVTQVVCLFYRCQ